MSLAYGGFGLIFLIDLFTFIQKPGALSKIVTLKGMVQPVHPSIVSWRGKSLCFLRLKSS
jgi:hypothetical protein